MLDFDKFNSLIKSKVEATEDDLKIREVLEACSNRGVVFDKEMINTINSKHLLKAYQEIYVKDIKNKEILKDMINGQYLIENLSYMKQTVIDDEEIY